MKRKPPTSTLSLAILGLISQEPLSGYDIRKVFTTTPMGQFSNSPGAIYPALRRMEKSGLIMGNIENRDTLRPRQIYTITDEGRKALKKRLSQPVARDDVVWRMDELMLRFAFMGDVLGKDGSLLFLRELKSRINEYIPYLQRHLEVQRELRSVNGTYALEQGIDKYKATARWANRVISKFQESPALENPSGRKDIDEGGTR
jgi:DNA-binding PadR family transcriptional regulator